MSDIARSRAKLKPLPKGVRLRGRFFPRSELNLIRSLTREYFTAGRTRISERVCEVLDWRQPNGWLKDRACRDVLRALHGLRLIRLPRGKLVRKSALYSKWQPLPRVHESVQAAITELPGPVSLRLAKGNADERLWNALVQQHHYLSHKVSVGRCLKFLILGGPTIVGAVSLAESAWNVQDRDRALRAFGWRRDDVANNTRFLILPHVKIRNLASRSLALLASDGVQAWKDYYSCELKCLETFVDTLRFAGTSYKAANWTLVGTTKGYRKSGASFHNSQTPKLVFLYPLHVKHREKLRRLQNERIENV